jgi:ABC-type transporter Mla subunit MlaD
MADRSDGSGRERKRIKTLAQAAMNADLTVGQLEDVLTGLGDTMNELNNSLSGLTGTVERLQGGLDHLDGTLSSLDELAKRLIALVKPAEAIAQRIDDILSLSETVMAPLTVTEHAVQRVLNAFRSRPTR